MLAWLEAFHMVAMMIWFAGLFYLPRLFVYHAQADDPLGRDRLKRMESQLFYGVMTPGAVLTVLLGFYMLSFAWQGYLSQGWMVAKLAIVAALIVYHVYCGILLRRFAVDDNRHGHTYYRWLNELPTVALIAIIILAVIKPL